MVESSDELVEKSELHDWVERETLSLDVVASWESLCETYKVLEFSSPISDEARLEEYKWIIREMNKHLARARKKLLMCNDPDSMVKTLMSMFTPTGGTTLENRKDVAYHKLRQQWIGQMIMQLNMMVQDMKEDTNGREQYWND